MGHAVPEIVCGQAVSATPLQAARGIVATGALVAAVFILGLGGWSAYAPLESAAMAPGVVEAMSSRKTVQHLEGGIVGAILVRDGDRVAAGQPLLRLDGTRARTALVALKGQLWDALAGEARLLAERDGLDTVAFPAELTARRHERAVAAILAGQSGIFAARRELSASRIGLIEQRVAEVRQEITGLQAQERALDTRLRLSAEAVATVGALVDRGLERRPRLLALQSERADAEGRRGQVIAEIARAEQRIAESRLSVLNLRNDLQSRIVDELRDTQKRIHELQEQTRAAQDVQSRAEVRAPVAGVVTNLRVHTVDGVIGPGAELLDIVPAEDRLIVAARLRPDDIDVVHAGMPAEVRLLPYKQRRIAPLSGTVAYVSADRLTDPSSGEPYYAAKIAVDERQVQTLDPVAMISGMPAEVQIRTGERTVAMYALAPILDSFNRAFREQ